jgi:serine/threonine protein kinase
MDLSKFDNQRYCRKDFEFLGSLGRNGISRVEKVKNITENAEYALKIFSKSEIETAEKFDELIAEKEILERCNHPGVLKLYGTFVDSEYVYFVLEYCAYGDFEKFLSRFNIFPYELVRFYSGELVSIISYLHCRGIVHGNLKPRNILVSESLNLKVTDFRGFKASNKRQVSSFLSADYISPELLDEGEYGAPSDMWALGCIIYQMLLGFPPFVSATQYTTFDRIRNGNVDFPSSLPPFAVDLIQSLLLPDPQLRIGVLDIEELTTHIFFQGLDIQRIFALTPPNYTLQMLPEPAVESKVILKDIVKKKCGWLYKKKILEINEMPSINYYEPVKLEDRNTIEISPQLKAEAKNKIDFNIITPKKTYYFKTISGSCEVWVNAVNDLVGKIYGY